MNGTPMPRVARSVQLAVMSAPSTTVDAAAAEARRRHDESGAWITTSALATRRGLPVAAAA